MTDPVIQLHDVSFRHLGSERPAVEHVSLQVRAGEFLGIIGPTGSGKTTLLYLMSGVIPHYVRGELSGEILVHGQPTRASSLAELAARLGVVLQDPEAQLFNLLVRDELTWGLENRGVPRHEIARRLEDTLAFFGIESLRDRITYDLSGGQKQRVALAAVHAITPEVLLFDNPTSQLDPIGAASVIQAVRQLVDEGKHTIVMVEDKIDELVEHAHRLVLLDRGRVALDAAPRDFCLQRDTLAAAGVRPPQIAELSHVLLQHGVAMPSPPILLDEAIPLYRQLLAARASAAAAQKAMLE